MLWGGKWEGGSCLGTHVRIKDFKIKKKFIYFNWRLITLQYCIGFAIHQHEFSMGIFSGLKEHKFIILQFWRLEVHKAVCFLKAPGIHFLFFSGS